MRIFQLDFQSLRYSICCSITIPWSYLFPEEESTTFKTEDVWKEKDKYQQTFPKSNKLL